MATRIKGRRLMLTDVGDSLPAIISTAMAMIMMSIITLGVAKRSGVSEIQATVSEANERLVSYQKDQIAVLEKDAKRKDARILKLETALAEAFCRIDVLEKQFTSDQLKKMDRDI